MSNVVSINSPRFTCVITSREIASILGKQHVNFMYTLRKFVREGLDITESSYLGGRWKDREALEFKLTRSQALAVANKLIASDSELLRKHLGEVVLADEKPQDHLTLEIDQLRQQVSDLQRVQIMQSRGLTDPDELVKQLIAEAYRREVK